MHARYKVSKQEITMPAELAAAPALLLVKPKAEDKPE
jgi:hypothetical protein